MEKRLVIRADGGRDVGLGHWFRCLFLVSCYRKIAPDLRVMFFTKNAADFKNVFPDTDIEVFQIGTEEGFINEVQEQDIVLLDGYFFTKDYFSKLHQIKAFIILVDDLQTSGAQADVIINHAPGTISADYKFVTPYTAFYLGGDFSMVSEVFRRSKTRKEKRLESLLVCMGGADPCNKTAFLLGAYKNFLNTYKNVFVVTGQQYQHDESLVEHQTTVANMQILKGIDKQEMAELMRKSGTAILPASTMALEYAHVGGILGIIKTAENQEQLHKGLLMEGVAKSVEEIISARDNSILYDQLSDMQSQLFDGISIDRFTKLFKEVELQKTIQMREARIEDVSIIFNWASDKGIRKYSFSKEEIIWSEHQKWFSLKLEDKNCLYLIAQSEGTAVGSIRFDIKDKEAFISYLVDSQFHGKGLGRIILAEGIKRLIESQKTFRYLVGFVLTENNASIRIFERLGFKKEAAEGNLKYFKEVENE